MNRDSLAFERCRCSFVPADPGAGPRPFRLPGDPERFGRPRPFDVHHLRLEGRLDHAARTFRATARLTISRRDPEARTMRLDAVAFDAISVRMIEGSRKNAAPFRYDGDAIFVEIDAGAVDKRVELEVSYDVIEPRRGLYFIAPDELEPGRVPQVWTQCQDEDAKFWIPCHDFPNVRMSTEFVITAPADWTVLSNGELVSVAPAAASKSGEKTWHWLQKEPHVAYLMTLVAGPLAEIVADMPNLPVRYYVQKGREDEGRRTFGRTPDMIAAFGKRLGVPYPWVKYHQVAVQDFTFGGMENTSATTMADRILLSERAAIDFTADDIVAHELAHQWFGDLVTCRDWSHAWLNEGFATFFEHLDWEAKGGDDAYLYNLKEHSDAYFGEDAGRYRRPVVCNTYASPIDLFDRHLYEKGAWVLHMLRRELGNELFFGGVKLYLERHRGGIVETRDFMRALEDRTGRSLEQFFDQWLHRGGFPEIEFEASFDADRRELRVQIRQTQQVDAVTPLFALRVAVDVVAEKHTERHMFAISEATHAFVVRCDAAPERVVFDPDGAVLMRLTLKLPRDWLLATLAGDPRAVARWRAAAALLPRVEPAVIDALARAIEKDAFWGVSAECARVLGEMRSARAFEQLATLTKVEHPKVRRAVVRALGDFRTEKASTVLAAVLEEGDASVAVESECARSLGRTRIVAHFDTLVAALARESWHDLVRIGAIDGLSALRDERAIEHIDRFAERPHYVGTRRTAVAALAELGENKSFVRERLERLLDAEDPYFTPEVMRALVRLRDPRAVGSVSSVMARSIDGRVKRHGREALRALRDREHPDSVRRLSDAVDRLRDDHRLLGDRVARLEPDAAATKKPRAGSAKSKKKASEEKKPRRVRAAKARKPRGRSKG